MLDIARIDPGLKGRADLFIDIELRHEFGDDLFGLQLAASRLQRGMRRAAASGNQGKGKTHHLSPLKHPLGLTGSTGTSCNTSQCSAIIPPSMRKISTTAKPGSPGQRDNMDMDDHMIAIGKAAVDGLHGIGRIGGAGIEPVFQRLNAGFGEHGVLDIIGPDIIIDAADYRAPSAHRGTSPAHDRDWLAPSAVRAIRSLLL